MLTMRVWLQSTGSTTSALALCTFEIACRDERWLVRKVFETDRDSRGDRRSATSAERH
jgi:hypothetical protein